ncbi:MAG: cystathionine beta-synthase [Planctomycetota bacterium]|nr:MAG: cystathionine beta-synthase [Planctomycetota bacterium]
MKELYESVLEVIGDTPLVRIQRLAEGLLPAVYAKIEFVNPGGSVKDRIALAMIEAAEREGLLRPGGTIIEATSGNTGVGLAMVAAVKGYRCIFVMPDKMSAEKIRLLKAYGAEVVMTPASAESNSPEGYSGVAARLANEIPNAFQPNQFTNLNNPNYHYHHTGPEIWRQTGGKITAFVSGIGTGGTISGVGRYLKEQNPKIQIVAADPEGSILSGDRPKPWAVEGIGEDYVPKTLNTQVIDEWIRVSDAESFTVARGMARKEGLLVGGSCGTAMAAALRFAERLGPDDLVVVMCPDTGRNYLSKMYSDDWMIEHGYMKPDVRRCSVGELIAARGNVPLIFVHPDDKAEDAIQLLRKHGISQLPVLEGDEVVGCLRELTLARLLHAGSDPQQVPVREIMAKPMPVVDEKVDVDEVYRLLSSGNSGVIVSRGKTILGIVTRIDLVNFWEQVLEKESKRETDSVQSGTAS